MVAKPCGLLVKKATDSRGAKLWELDWQGLAVSWPWPTMKSASI